MPKRQCKFSDTYCKEWKFIKRGRFEYEAECSVCNCFISIGHGGRSDIVDHIKSKKHTNRFAAPSCSKTLQNYFVVPQSSEDNKVRAAELTLAYHTVKHHHTFRSSDCTNKLNSILFDDSSIAKKFSSARTKLTALVNGVIAPQSLKESVDNIKKSNFYGISTDASNHKAAKIFPFVVQFFDINEGIQSKLMRVCSLPNETSDEISSFCLSTMEKFDLEKNKCVAFCGDNTNTNFGGLERKGKMNVFTKLKAALQKNIEGIGCPAHVLHNCMHTAADTMSCDIETIIVKIFSYFSIYTVRTERLKEFCDYVGTEYMNIMCHSKTRWLSLLPAVERVIRLFEPLKEFFLNEKNAPNILVKFFTNPISEAYLWFIHNQLSTFQHGIKKIEGSTKSIIEIVEVLQNVLETVTNRKEQNFMSLNVKSVLKKEEVPQSAEHNFKEDVSKFYGTCVEYLSKWSSSFSPFFVFDWMLLKRIPKWEDIEKTVVYLNEKQIEIDDSILFDQFGILKNFIAENLKKWNDENEAPLQCHEKWVSFFKHCDNLQQYTEMEKIAKYLFAIPAHNANTERIFSFMNIQWTDERNRMEVETLEAILQVLYNYKMDCMEFYSYVLKNKEMIKKAGSSEKYSFLRDQVTPSTSSVH